MADTKVSYTVKVYSSIESYHLLYSIYKIMGSLRYIGDIMKDDVDEARQTFRIDGGCFDRISAIMNTLKAIMLLKEFDYRYISFKVYGVEDADYGTVIPFLIDCTKQEGTYQETVLSLFNEMEFDEGFEDDILLDSEEEASNCEGSNTEDYYETNLPFSSPDMCFSDEGMKIVENTLAEDNAKKQPLERAEPLRCLSVSKDIHLEEFKKSYNMFEELFR